MRNHQQRGVINFSSPLKFNFDLCFPLKGDMQQQILDWQGWNQGSAISIRYGTYDRIALWNIGEGKLLLMLGLLCWRSGFS